MKRGFISLKNVEKRNPDKRVITILLLFLGINFMCFCADDTSIPDQNEEKLLSAEKCYEWLKNNPEDPQYNYVLNNYIIKEENPHNLIDSLNKLLPSLKDEGLIIDVAITLAQIEEMMGRVEQACNHYDLAARKDKSSRKYTSLLNSARLFLEQGFHEKVLSITDEIIKNTNDQRLEIEAKLLQSKAYILSDKPDKSKLLLAELIKRNAGSEQYGRILFYYVDLLIYLGEKEEANLVLDKMRKQGSPNPEFSLGSMLLSGKHDMSIRLYQTPIFLHYDAAETEQKITPEPADGVFIQVGSFTVLENAKILQSELKDKKINAIIMEKTIDDKIHFKVVIKVIDEKVDINALIIKLKTLGYEGYLVK